MNPRPCRSRSRTSGGSILLVLVLLAGAGCATGDGSPPPAAAEGETSANGPPQPAAEPRTRPPELLSSADACWKALREGRFKEIHENADDLLHFVTDADSRRTILSSAAYADVQCEDYPAALRHSDRFREEREPVMGKRDWRDFVVHVSRGVAAIGLAKSPEEAEAARQFMVEDSKNIEGSEAGPGLVYLRSAALAARPFFFDLAYGGKYTRDEALRQGEERVHAAMPAAMESVRRRLNRPGLEFPPLTVRFEDGEPTRQEGFMTTNSCTMSRAPRAIVTVYTEHLRAERTACESMMAHELVHALRLSVAHESEDPVWLGEGLAHWGSREDEADVRLLCLQRILDDPLHPEASLASAFEPPDVLATRPEQVQRLVGAYLFHFIERTRGIETARRLAHRLLETWDYGAVLKEVLDATPEGWIEAAREDAPGWFHQAFPRWPEVMSIYELCKAGRSEEVLAQWDSRFAHGGVCWEAMMAGIARVFALRDLGRWEEAVWCIRRQQTGPMGKWAMPSLRYGELKYLRELENWEEVASLGKEALRDIVWKDEERQAEIAKWVEEAEGKLKR